MWVVHQAIQVADLPNQPYNLRASAARHAIQPSIFTSQKRLNMMASQAVSQKRKAKGQVP